MAKDVACGLAALSGLTAVLLLSLPPGSQADEQGAPAASSLAPLDVEAFRSRYGQAALFRLRLGIDSTPDPGGACAGPAPAWGESAERPRYDQALAEGSYYRAGQIFAGWRHLAARCH
jgi:hypothetical protein